MNSPIRYYGGKGGLYKTIISEFPSDFGSDTRTCNDGSADIYIEPFGGSGTILFHKKPSPIEVYNDLEHNVYSFFKVLSNPKRFKAFQKKCGLIFYSRDLFNEYNYALRNHDLSMEDRAFYFFYVNRVAYNGVGSFSCSVNAVRRGMSKPVSDMLSTIDRLPEVHQRLKNVIVESIDGLKLIKKYDKPTAFFYLDPPYHHSTRSGARYDVDMNNDKQEELLRVLEGVKDARILLSGYNCDLFDNLLDCGWNRVDFGVNTQSGKRESKSKVESLWRNYSIDKEEPEKIFDKLK